MRIYKLTYKMKNQTEEFLHTSTQKTVFAGSKSECAKKRSNIRQIKGYVPNSIQTYPLDLDTRKTALINFLNTEIV